ncbi:DUF4861 family protein [Chitinophaga sp. Cy-1792]|uniref:DUF4861 family protein n=1 Tax=Chitinophaga sp. Cy-1792 TaxID=2608339 RepID=UPI00141F8C61|nr:DUF4861 family protein [Chitinophaga sp. Cy-1792]NIG53342.1 DUF4861 domain-containing protein [Chitinophaga sp. Cy-1792]
MIRNIVMASLSGLALFHASTAKCLPVGDSTLNAPAILGQMEKVATWQWNKLDNRGWSNPQTNWTNGAMYTGMFKLAQVSENPFFMQRLVRVGTDNNWNTGPDRFFADEYCIGQTYSQLYTIYKEPRMIERWRKLADSIVAAPHTESLEWVNGIHHREWAWCDALYMGPTALAYLTTATGDAKYLATADKLWWKTSDFLYSKEDSLYYRDASYFGKKEANGKRVFWSRGNGWVMGGLVRMMDNMPATYAGKAKFVEQFKQMAYKIAALQNNDGTWHASLLDPDSYPSKETSGTGFYVYALMWGVNNNILPAKDFMPVIKKGWEALVSCVQPNGKLGFVQVVAAAPGKATAEDTDVYGVGAFLLAGSEIIKFDIRQQGGTAIEMTNNIGVDRPGEIVELDMATFSKAQPKTAAKSFRIVNAVTGKEIPYQLIYNGEKTPSSILLQINAAPGATVTALVKEGTPAPVKARAYGRYVPERKDDYAWENDRMAYRMYGKALEQVPKEMAFGIDVWAKRTEELVINEWYKTDNYHHDNGQGLDFYSVGLTLGAGDNAPVVNDSIRYPKNYRQQKTLDNGPLRTAFALTYEQWNAGGIPVTVTKTISLDAGSQLNRISLQYSFKGKELPVVTGIVKRKEPGTILLDEKTGVMGYWEPQHGEDGTIGLGCVFPEGKPGMKTDDVHLLTPGIAQNDKPYVYYAGATWSKGGWIANSAEWFNYLENFSQRVNNKIAITLQNNIPTKK